MRTRLFVSVTIVALALGLGWYVAAQDTTLRTDFQNGDVLFATDVNATNAQVNSNTAAITALTTTSNRLRFEAILTGAQEVTLSDTPPSLARG